MWTTQTTNNVQSRSAKAQFVAATSVWSNLQDKDEALPSLHALKASLEAGGKNSLAKAQANALRLIGRKKI